MGTLTLRITINENKKKIVVAEGGQREASGDGPPNNKVEIKEVYSSGGDNKKENTSADDTVKLQYGDKPRNGVQINVWYLKSDTSQHGADTTFINP